MNYRHDKRRKQTKLIIWACLGVALIFFLFQGGRLEFLSRFINRVTVPIWKTEQAFTRGFLTEVVTSKKELLNQNEMLRAKLAEDEIRLQQVEILEQENEHLKEIFLRTTGDNNVIASILTKPTQSPYGTVILDVGEAEGVRPEDLVFALGDVVVGEVESVDTHTSKVILFSAPGYISQVTIGTTGRYFNAKGRGAGDFELSLPRELSVEEGELLLYPGLHNYIVGVVERVEFDPRDSYKKVLFRSAVNIQEIKWLSVKITQ